jgi:hypothetical protein
VPVTTPSCATSRNLRSPRFVSLVVLRTLRCRVVPVRSCQSGSRASTSPTAQGRRVVLRCCDVTRIAPVVRCSDRSTHRCECDSHTLRSKQGRQVVAVRSRQGARLPLGRQGCARAEANPADAGQPFSQSSATIANRNSKLYVGPCARGRLGPSLRPGFVLQVGQLATRRSAAAAKHLGPCLPQQAAAPENGDKRQSRAPASSERSATFQSRAGL